MHTVALVSNRGALISVRQCASIPDGIAVVINGYMNENTPVNQSIEMVKDEDGTVSITVTAPSGRLTLFQVS